jgi:hypothetical protein
MSALYNVSSKEIVGLMGVKTEITQYEKPANLALREGLAGL